MTRTIHQDQENEKKTKQTLAKLGEGQRYKYVTELYHYTFEVVGRSKNGQSVYVLINNEKLRQVSNTEIQRQLDRGTLVEIV